MVSQTTYLDHEIALILSASDLDRQYIFREPKGNILLSGYGKRTQLTGELYGGRPWIQRELTNGCEVAMETDNVSFFKTSFCSI